MGGVDLFNRFPDSIKIHLLTTVFIGLPLLALLRMALFKPKLFAYFYFGLYIPLAVEVCFLSFQNTRALLELPNWLEIMLGASLPFVFVFIGYFLWYLLAVIMAPLIVLKTWRIKILGLARYRRINLFVAAFLLTIITVTLFGYGKLIGQMEYFQYFLK